MQPSLIPSLNESLDVATTAPAPRTVGRALHDFWRACVRAFDLSGAHGPMPPL